MKSIRREIILERLPEGAASGSVWKRRPACSGSAAGAHPSGAPAAAASRRPASRRAGTGPGGAGGGTVGRGQPEARPTVAGSRDSGVRRTRARATAGGRAGALTAGPWAEAGWTDRTTARRKAGAADGGGREEGRRRGTAPSGTPAWKQKVEIFYDCRMKWRKSCRSGLGGGALAASPPDGHGRVRKWRRRSVGSSMASRAKRRAVGSGAPRPPGGQDPRDDDEGEDEVDDEDDEGSGGEEDDDDDDDDEMVGEEVNIDFEAYSISDSDHDGVKKLLQQLFLKAPVNTAELTDLLTQQNHIGSVIKQTDVSEDSDDDMDEDEIFGFISLLNLTERKGTQCAEQIKELVLSSCEKNCGKSVVEQLEKRFNDTTQPVGLLLSERFLNVPPQIALPMHQQLQKELAEAQKTNKPCGKCSFYLLISKTFTEAGRPSSKKGSGHKDVLMFANAEEEFFYEKAVVRFSYSVQEESDTCLSGRWSFDDMPMKPLRTVMLIPGDKMSDIMEKLKEHLSL